MSLIEKELKDGDNKYWFYRKQQKNLHNIDTFYYSVMLNNDFIEPGDENVHFFLTQLDAFKNRCLESNEIYGEIYTPFDPLDFRCSDNLVYAIGKGNYAHMLFLLMMDMKMIILHLVSVGINALSVCI